MDEKTNEKIKYAFYKLNPKLLPSDVRVLEGAIPLLSTEITKTDNGNYFVSEKVVGHCLSGADKNGNILITTYSDLGPEIRCSYQITDQDSIYWVNKYTKQKYVVAIVIIDDPETDVATKIQGE